jgi:hypothetical protein
MSIWQISVFGVIGLVVNSRTVRWDAIHQDSNRCYALTSKRRSGSSRSAGAQFFGGAHRDRVCVRVFIGVSVRACCERLRCTVSF